MDIINDDAELVKRIRLYAYGGKAPADVADALQNVPGSAADLMTTAPEILYAHYDQLDDDAKLLVGQLYQRAIDQTWTAFNREGRSAAIVSLVRRDLGEKGSGVAGKAVEWPEPETQRRGGVDWRVPAEASEKTGE